MPEPYRQKGRPVWRVNNRECLAKCGRHDRIYVAISDELNSNARSIGRPWSGSYVIRVGSGKACWDRETSANGVDINGRRRKDCQPPHAGVTEWEILKCWSAVVPAQDDKLFRPWAKKHIRWVKPGVFDATGKKKRDLYCLSPEQVAAGEWLGTGDDQNDEIVAVAIKSLRLRIAAGRIVDLTRACMETTK